MTNEPARESFERWASDEGEWSKAIEKDHTGQYKLMQTSLQWNAWRCGWIAALEHNKQQKEMDYE